MTCPCRATEYALMENAKRGKRIAELEECLLTAEERLAQVTRERDEARASVADAYRRGAEAMREACIGSACAFVMEYPSYCDDHGDELDAILSALPIPEEP